MRFGGPNIGQHLVLSQSIPDPLNFDSFISLLCRARGWRRQSVEAYQKVAVFD